MRFLNALLTICLLVFFAAWLNGRVHAGDLYLELGAGVDPDEANPRSVIRVRYETRTPWWAPDVVELDHHSSIFRGRPFNGRNEMTSDQVSVIWRFKLK